MSSNPMIEEAAFAVAGNLISVAGGVNITNLYTNQVGPLPLTGYFTSSGGALIIFVSGSGWSNNSAGFGTISMSVTLNGSPTPLGSCQVFANSIKEHQAMIPVCFFVPANGLKGQHIITLTATNGTQTDGNDSFNVTILEAVPVQSS